MNVILGLLALYLIVVLLFKWVERKANEALEEMFPTRNVTEVPVIGDYADDAPRFVGAVNRDFVFDGEPLIFNDVRGHV